MTHRTAPEVAPESAWTKSSYSQENGNACVEIADLTSSGHVGVRDSKDPEGPALLLDHEQFSAFIAEVRVGRYDV